MYLYSFEFDKDNTIITFLFFILITISNIVLQKVKDHEYG